jgi:hypothetical protein
VSRSGISSPRTSASQSRTISEVLLSAMARPRALGSLIERSILWTATSSPVVCTTMTFSNSADAACSTVLFPARMLPSPSRRMLRPAPNCLRLAATASRPRLVPRFACGCPVLGQKSAKYPFGHFGGVRKPRTCGLLPSLEKVSAPPIPLPEVKSGMLRSSHVGLLIASISWVQSVGFDTAVALPACHLHVGFAESKLWPPHAATAILFIAQCGSTAVARSA